MCDVQPTGLNKTMERVLKQENRWYQRQRDEAFDTLRQLIEEQGKREIAKYERIRQVIQEEEI